MTVTNIVILNMMWKEELFKGCYLVTTNNILIPYHSISL